MNIRIGDFKPEQKHIDAVAEVIKSGRITEGPKVKELENVMSKYLNVKNAIMVTNGTVALELVSVYLKIKNAEKRLNVITTALTFPATVNAFAIGGFPIAMCDCKEDLQIDLDTLNDTVKESTDIIVPVHLMGYPANMDKVMEDAKKYDWIVIEDAAEAFGAEYKGKKVGTIGDFGCYSFYVSHNIIGGELGMVVTNNDEAAKIMRSIKNHGRVGSTLTFNHEYVGSNYKTNEFCAAIALENMKDVDNTLRIRKNNCQYFFDNIKNNKLKPFPITEGFSPLGYPIACESEEYRNSICKKLNDAGIETRNMFPCIVNQKAYKNLFLHYKFPVADKMEKTVFYIGVHKYLTEDDKKRIIKEMNK